MIKCVLATPCNKQPNKVYQKAYFFLERLHNEAKKSQLQVKEMFLQTPY